jgi:hypothetical protein
VSVKSKVLNAVLLLSICLGLLVAVAQSGSGQSLPDAANRVASQGIPFGCAVQPEPHQGPAQSLPRPQVPISRFRQVVASTPKPNAYSPKEVVALADSTNYGQRFIKDALGKLAEHAPIVVLHETVGSVSSAVNFFQTPHPYDDDQVSYHTLVGLDGTVYYLVPPDKRAFGAGNSAFVGSAGEESVKTNPDLPASVNNFAYHISLETPADGDNNNSSHSGYTSPQYQSLAWIVAKTSVPPERITYHKIVDRSGSRQDPRSFNAQTFLQLLENYPKTSEIVIGCSMPLAAPAATEPAEPAPLSPVDRLLRRLPPPRSRQ